MQNDLAMIIPAAGRGSRFAKLGIMEPKPLVDLYGRPFFWWAVESVRRKVPIRQLVFVVLEEHIADFSIDKIIKSFYADATVVAIPEVTGGAAETARIGLDALKTKGPVAINDCDHAFECQTLSSCIEHLENGTEGMLVSFRSGNPAYSYIQFDSSDEITGTIEKRAVSPFAIAGCYLFADSERFIALYELYKKECPYDEFFVSGIFNLMVDKHMKIRMLELERHCSFGTPEEQAGISTDSFAPFLLWKQAAHDY